MATVQISLDEYLRAPAPEPDMEYIDGELKEKPVVQRVHDRLQAIISAWFEDRAEEWVVVPSPELRTKVSSRRVRLPDMVISVAGYPSQVQIDPPLIVIEIVSPSDSFSELREKLDDYERMGIPNVWVIDPQLRQSWVSSGAGLSKTSRFMVEGSPIYLDVAETFARYDRFR